MVSTWLTTMIRLIWNGFNLVDSTRCSSSSRRERVWSWCCTWDFQLQWVNTYFFVLCSVVSSSEKLMSIPGFQSSASIQGWRSVDNHAVPGDEVTCVCQAGLGAWGHHCCALLPGNFSSGWEWEMSWTWVWLSWTRPGCHLTSPSDLPKTRPGWVRGSFKTNLDDGEKLRHNPKLNHLKALARDDLWLPPVFVWQIVQTSFSLHKFWRAILDNATEVLTGYKGQKQQSSFKGPRTKHHSGDEIEFPILELERMFFLKVQILWNPY